MPELSAQTERGERSVLIAVADLTRYTQYTRRTPDAELAETMAAFYARVEAAITAAGGLVVKFMGDAALMVFEADRVDAGVLALLDLKRDIDAFWDQHGWQARMIVKVHFDTVIAGPFGLGRFDILGGAVNQTFRLESSGFALSAAAFRKLAPETRKRFKKHTPPITYIRSEDRHM